MTTLTIAGHAFEVADDPRFVPGATIELDEGVASTLQQVRRENLRNNFASRVRSVLDELPEGQDELPGEKAQELQAALNEYASKYSFGVRAAGGRRVVDPTEREATKLAREDISAAYFAKHAKRLKGEELATAAEKLLEARHDDYMTRARRNIRDRERAAAAVLDFAA